MVRVLLKLFDHEVEGVGQAVKALVADLAGFDNDVALAGAHVVVGVLEPVEGGQRPLEHPAIDGKADENAADGEEGDQQIGDVVWDGEDVADGDDGAEDGAGDDDAGVGDEDFVR